MPPIVLLRLGESVSGDLEPFEKANDVIGLDVLQLYSIQMQSLHSQLRHILLIRSWASTLTAGLLIALVHYRDPIVAAGTIVIGVFWIIDYRYGVHLDLCLRREWALRGEILERIPNGSVKTNFGRHRGSPRTRELYYGLMLLAVIVPAFYVGLT